MIKELYMCLRLIAEKKNKNNKTGRCNIMMHCEKASLVKQFKEWCIPNSV